MRLRSLGHSRICACLVAFCLWLSAGEARADETEDLLALAAAVNETAGDDRWIAIRDLTDGLGTRAGPADEDGTQRSIMAYLLWSRARALAGTEDRDGATSVLGRSMEWAGSYEAANALLYLWDSAGQPRAIARACAEWSKPAQIAAFVATREDWRDQGLREANGEADVDAWLARFREAADQVGGLDRVRASLTGPEKALVAARSQLTTVARDDSGTSQPTTVFYACAYLGYIADRQGKRGTAASWYRKALEHEVESADPLFTERFADTRDRAREGIKRRVLWMRHLDGSPLHAAASEGRADEVRLLVNAGTDVNATEKNGSTALHAAASSGHRDVVRVLLDAGADLGAGGDWTPLHDAVSGGHRGVARLLLDAGANVNAGAGAGHGWTPLHVAVEKRRRDVARLLLDAGADVRAGTGWTPLHEAGVKGDKDLVAMLLDRAEDLATEKPEPPVATIVAQPVDGSLNVLFDSPADPDGAIVLYEWDFGDGQGGVGPHVAHSYSSEGRFQAELTVTDYAGQTDTATVLVSVTVPASGPVPVPESMLVAERTRPDKIAVVVDTDITPLIQTRLDRYVADLKASGCAAEVREWMTGVENEPVLLKQHLMSVPGITGAVFIGAIAPAYYEYDEDHLGYERFACDLYYMDFAAQWSDSDGDSFFDTITGEPYPEIWVSRLYAANLEDAFPGLSEADLINRYLDKNHDFRTGALRLRNRALAYHDDTRGWWTDCGMSQVYSRVKVVNDGETTSAADMMSHWDDKYESAWLTAHSTPTRHGFYNGGSRGRAAGSIVQMDIATRDPQVLFWNLACCRAASFAAPRNCIANCYVFAPTYGLSVWGSAKDGAMEYDHDQYFAALAQGKSTGEAFRRWFTLNCEPIVKYKRRGYGLTLLGDGTLKLGRFMDGNETP